MQRVLTTLLFCGLLLTGGIWADDTHMHARRLVEEGRIQPLSAILSQAEVFRSGEILEVDLEEEDDGLIYEIEFLDNAGQVWELKFDAVTGSMIERERED